MGTEVLTPAQAGALREALAGRLVALCFGSGVDSTAMIVALHAAGIEPDVMTFANTGGEKRESLDHLARMNQVLRSWGWREIQEVALKPMASTGYTTLEGNCLKNETLPSLAFGMKSCSIKWKQQPQDNFLMGVSRGPNACQPHPLWLRAQATGQRIVKLIGYDAGKADRRRTASLSDSDGTFDFLYPLQLLGWSRLECVRAIAQYLGAHMVPIKSACFFCPASKEWELWWLAGEHPDLLERALFLERRALTGKHSRFDELHFGASWEHLVRNADRFPSSDTSVGLGRTFAWNQWAWKNSVVDADFRVRREHREAFLARSEALRGPDNALDARSGCGVTPAQLARLHATEQGEIDMPEAPIQIHRKPAPARRTPQAKPAPVRAVEQAALALE